MMRRNMLDERICDTFEWENNEQTFRGYINELERMTGIKEPDIDSMTNDDILKYIDSLWVISAVCC